MLQNVQEAQQVIAMPPSIDFIRKVDAEYRLMLNFGQDFPDWFDG